MAEKLCTLRTKGGGGGRYTETSLWTNPSPSADFAAQTVTLSDSISNYKYIAVVFKAAKTLTDTIKTIVSIEDVAKLVGGANTLQVRLGAVNNNASYSYSRNFYKASDTTISFGSAYATNTQASSNTMAIPLEILGINELAHGTVQTAMGTCERGTSPVTVNLGFRPSFVSLYKTNASSSSTSAGDSLFVADTGLSTSYVLSAYKESSGSTFTKVAMNNYITITDMGFTFASSSIATFRGTYRYVAIGSTTE